MLQSTNDKKKKKLNRFLYVSVVISFLVPVVFLIARMIFGDVPSNEAGYHSDADYILMIIQCLLGLIVINLPTFLARKLRFELPMALYGMYIIFLYCAIFLGEVRSFYYVIPFWDSILHAFSSLMLGFFGFMAITVLLRDEHIVMSLSPIFTAVFAFCFALSIGTIWEIYEYVFDGILGLNMQKFMTVDGTLLIGHAALADTMKDIIIDAIGALTATVIGSIANKYDRRWIKPTLKQSDITSI
ncbi:MAG: hypothetical protein MJ064_05705 [Lachnospiraceae bacterium]|nr:hypothetical protein [Lachnospiraceae bacterium]